MYEDKKSLELKKKNEKRINRIQRRRINDICLIRNYLWRIIQYIRLGNISYAFYALKRAIKIAISHHDTDNVAAAGEFLDISDRERIVIYTVLFGNYDSVKEPLFITPNCDYYIITDQEINNDTIWKKYPLNKFKRTIQNFSNLEKARFFKLHPHLLFPEYRYSMFIDANIRMVTDMRPVFSQLGANVIAIHNQPGRDCAYQEATEVIVIGKADSTQVIKQMKCYKKEGFPQHYGLFRTCVVVRKHNDLTCKKLMLLWWKDLKKFTKRDQLSFTHALWELNLNKNAVSNLGFDLRTNPRFIEYIHKQRI